MTMDGAVILGFLCCKGHHWDNRQNCTVVCILDGSFNSANVSFLVLIILLWFMESGEYPCL